MTITQPTQAAIDQQIKELLAETSPLQPDEIDDSLLLVDLGVSSLQIQILAARIEDAFGIRFGDTEFGDIETVGHLAKAVERHRSRKSAL